MKVNKIISRIHRKLIFLLDGVNSKLYMKKYNNWLKKNGVVIANEVKYIHHTVYLDGLDFSKIFLGNNVVISRNVTILIHDFSIEAGLTSIGEGNLQNEARFIKEVKIGNNSFIGAGSIILPGAIIGDNCIIGAGTVVPGKKFPINSIIVGNPARIIGKVDEWTKAKIKEGMITRGNIV